MVKLISVDDFSSNAYVVLVMCQMRADVSDYDRDDMFIR